MNQTISSGISIYALGGLGEVGKNMYVLESDTSIIIIDSGVMFPGSEMPGVDYVIPDYTHLKNNRGKIRALFITHGHEDHIGGIPFLIQSVHIPVIYAPKLAAALIKHKLEDMRIKEPVKIIEYNPDSILQVDVFKVSFFHVTHSIPDAYGICVDTPDGRIVHTGDFKIDLTPVGPDIELDKIARIGSEGVDLLLSDSTNAEIEGYTPSETSIIAGINEIFGKADGRLIVSTFSSNISRIQQLVEAAIKHNRKIAIVGRSMENAVATTRAMGYIKLSDKDIVDLDNIQNYRANELCILCTGSQGEPMAALARIANGEHKSLRIYPGDTVVFSSSVIPGNGVLIDKIVNQLVRRGANVLTNSILLNIHSSGHPAKQELRLMLKLMNPRYFMPIHGEYRMLKLHTDLAVDLGMDRKNTFVMANGDTLTLRKRRVTEGARVPADAIYIDGRDINGLSTAVIHDREILKDDGMVAVLISIDSKANRLIVPPVIHTRGFVLANHSKLIAEGERIINGELQKLMSGRVTFNEIKSTIKNTLGKYLFSQTERHPMIIPVIMNQN
ncbi:MAG: ribonuclease J [Erysipelotrichia bacterium]|jgi:ribonuclease J|nr:ribonuclease J [Erysipelotrichia bacterium]